MNLYIFKNKEFVHVIIAAVSLFMFFALLSCFIMALLWNRYHQELTERDISIIGSLIEKHPELENDIISSFTKSLDNTDLEKGIESAVKYGYTPSFKINISHLTSSFQSKSVFAVLCIVTVFFLFTGYYIFGFAGNIYSKLDNLVLDTEKIMNGNFNIKFPERGEGTLPKLGFHFNQMSGRLQLTVEDLKHERKLLKNMISDISHQFKTPLSSLMTFNELLLRQETDNPEIRQEFIKRSIEQIERMQWLIQVLLKLSRLEANAIEFDFSDDNIKTTVQEAVKNLYPSIKEKNLNMHIGENNEHVYLKHDRRWLGEALQNLIQNSIDHTPSGGDIYISFHSTDSTFKITVEDTGTGIAKEDLPNIFNRFYRGRKTGSSVMKKGSGIGLSLVKLIVEKHGGFVQIDSGPNRGTTAAITLSQTFHKNQSQIDMVMPPSCLTKS